MKYEMLLEEATSNNIYIIENADFKSKADGLINGNVIGINKKVRSYYKRNCILAEELGHYHTSIGNILDQSDENNRKQELRARMWAYDKLVGLSGIISAYENGCQNLYDIADYLEVTEDFLSEALEQYRSKYGTSIDLDKYTISFVPTLEVIQK